MSVFRRRPIVAAVALGLSLSVSPIQAAYIKVDSNSDTASDVCRLRDAIDAANTNTAVAGCLAGDAADTILLIVNGSTVVLQNSAFLDNFAPRGAGIYASFGTISLVNSVIARSQGGGEDCFYSSGVITPIGGNVVGDGGAECGIDGADGLLSGDPKFESLAKNGGQTMTFRPLPDSPVIDAGDNTEIPDGVDFDQRGAGFTRIFNSTVDLGAVEFQTADFVIFSDGFETVIVDSP